MPASWPKCRRGAGDGTAKVPTLASTVILILVHRPGMSAECQGRLIVEPTDEVVWRWDTSKRGCSWIARIWMHSSNHSSAAKAMSNATFRSMRQSVITSKRTFVDVRRRIKNHLAPFFGNRRMITDDAAADPVSRAAGTTAERGEGRPRSVRISRCVERQRRPFRSWPATASWGRRNATCTSVRGRSNR